jgi:hypothetical protein
MTAAAQLAQITVALAEARAAAGTGAGVTLEGLVAVVEDALRAARAATPEERPSLMTEMIGLLKELDALSAALSRQHHAEAQQRAAAAYGGGRGE